jgi:DNA-binding LytR/AlgR family response regulator
VTTALIADDEPRLAEALAGELHALWPELIFVETAHNGRQALDLALQRRPDLVFLDIRMPGMDGLQAAGAIIDDWPIEAVAPLIVFVTAFDEFAVRAFDRAAVDYLLKPVTAERLARTVERLKARLADRTAALGIDALASRLHAVLEPAAPGSPTGQWLKRIRAGVGDSIRLIPIEEVVMFEATDKYVNVITSSGEALIRESMRELLPQLEPQRFGQIHRGTIVNLDYVESAQRMDNGKLQLKLRGRPERPVVSRLYQHLFKPM